LCGAAAGGRPLRVRPSPLPCNDAELEGLLAKGPAAPEPAALHGQDAGGGGRGGGGRVSWLLADTRAPCRRGGGKERPWGGLPFVFFSGPKTHSDQVPVCVCFFWVIRPTPARQRGHEPFQLLRGSLRP